MQTMAPKLRDEALFALIAAAPVKRIEKRVGRKADHTAPKPSYGQAIEIQRVAASPVRASVTIGFTNRSLMDRGTKARRRS